MLLLSGAEITILYSEQNDFYTAHVYIGSTSSYASDKDPYRAIGKAILKQYGCTPKGLKTRLAAWEERKRKANENFA